MEEGRSLCVSRPLMSAQQNRINRSIGRDEVGNRLISRQSNKHAGEDTRTPFIRVTSASWT